MDGHALDTINKANSNIEELIEDIIELRKTKEDGYCCYPDKQFTNVCNGKCDFCKEDYYDKMYEEMIEKYGVSL